MGWGYLLLSRAIASGALAVMGITFNLATLTSTTSPLSQDIMALRSTEGRPAPPTNVRVQPEKEESPGLGRRFHIETKTVIPTPTPTGRERLPMEAAGVPIPEVPPTQTPVPPPPPSSSIWKELDIFNKVWGLLQGVILAWVAMKFSQSRRG